MMKPSPLIFNLFLFSFSVSVGAVTVRTDSGDLSGTIFKTFKGRLVNAFLGIPFAKPPVGELRFKEPQPAEKWEGIRPAHNFSSRCIQYTYYNMRSEPIVGDEDCLYLNVFTPSVSNASKLDVIFYIHGGAFMFGGGDIFTPDFILDHHDIVYVTVNYRLGVFGFLSTEDEVIPGNNGLKDQVLALKWVQNNIEQFGGDKDRVTIAGLSAGGASVHLHYLSSQSKDLFHQGISLSGSALCPWVLADKSRLKAQMLANSVQCPTENSKLLFACLQKKDARSLLSQTQELFMPWNYNPFSPFGPVVEPDSKMAFLSNNPYKLMAEGNIKDAPWLTSTTTEEGLYPAAAFITDEKQLQELNDNWNKIAPHLLDYNHTVSQENLNKVNGKIRTFYFADRAISKEVRKDLIQMVSDRLFVADIERAARLQASITKSPVYFYSFAYRGKFSTSEFLCRCTENLGASHADDLFYLLKTGWAPMETKDDTEMMETMVNMWASFIHSGVPSASPDTVWTPVSPDAADGGNLTHLVISSNNDIRLASSIDLGNRAFWDTLPFNELWNAGDKGKRYVDEL